MIDASTRPLEALDAMTDAFATRARSSTFQRSLDAAERPVIVDVRPECAPDFTIPLVLSDREQLRSIAGAHGGELPAAFAYRKRCAVCAHEHAFDVEVGAEELSRLRRELRADRPEPEAGRFTRLGFPDLGPQRDVSSFAPTFQNHRDLPLRKANRLSHEGREEPDHDRAVAKLEESIRLYESVPYHDAPAAQVRLALAERLVDREPKRALELVRQALPVLTGPALRPFRERARELEERLAA
jgi:hypothetical protein